MQGVPGVRCSQCVPRVRCVPSVRCGQCVPRVRCVPSVRCGQCVPRVRCVPSVREAWHDDTQQQLARQAKACVLGDAEGALQWRPSTTQLNSHELRSQLRAGRSQLRCLGPCPAAILSKSKTLVQEITLVVMLVDWVLRNPRHRTAYAGSEPCRPPKVWCEAGSLRVRLCSSGAGRRGWGELTAGWGACFVAAE